MLKGGVTPQNSTLMYRMGDPKIPIQRVPKATPKVVGMVHPFMTMVMIMDRIVIMIMSHVQCC